MSITKLIRPVSVLSKFINQTPVMIRFKSEKPKAKKPKSPWADGGEHATLNDIPLPEGSYKEWYDKRNGRYHLYLISGVLVFAIEMGLWKAGTFDDIMYLNNKIPEYPYDEDCEDDKKKAKKEKKEEEKLEKEAKEAKEAK
ncbi:uncharacterized protein LOC119678906 [Teleopsis dalmanni]|uniref:uncharacterized protein LOC119678906 n=1 Tax=Teleopsis dalmanni TaxID=139649 RepID=UPI0018CD570D|nr:uncharacterized protein LOC119678906 [Teleopsis dalmanni]